MRGLVFDLRGNTGLDAFSRKIVGWAMAEHLRTELVRLRTSPRRCRCIQAVRRSLPDGEVAGKVGGHEEARESFLQSSFVGSLRAARRACCENVWCREGDSAFAPMARSEADRSLAPMPGSGGEDLTSDLRVMSPTASPQNPHQDCTFCPSVFLQRIFHGQNSAILRARERTTQRS